MDKNIIEEIVRVSKKEQWPYPKIFQTLKDAGIRSYEVKTASHQIVYSDGVQMFQEPIPPGFTTLTVAKSFCADSIKAAILSNQRKEIDYEEFLKRIAQGGGSSYHVSMETNTITYFGEQPGSEYKEIIPVECMDLKKAAEHCEKAWSAFADKHNIKRPDEFFLFKMQEELGELVRTFLEIRGCERRENAPEELQKKFEGDCASLIGNALILALHFGVDIEKKIKEKFPVQCSNCQ